MTSSRPIDPATAEVARLLAEHFDLDALLLGRAAVLAETVPVLLAAMDASTIVDHVARYGGLAGARSPCGVVLWRLRQVLADLDARATLDAAAAEERRARQVAQATRRGRLLAHVVAQGDETAANARATLAAEFGDDLAELALGAFEAALR